MSGSNDVRTVAVGVDGDQICTELRKFRICFLTWTLISLSSFLFCTSCSRRITDIAVGGAISAYILLNINYTIVGMVFQPRLNQEADHSCHGLWMTCRTLVTNVKCHSVTISTNNLMSIMLDSPWWSQNKTSKRTADTLQTVGIWTNCKSMEAEEDSSLDQLLLDIKLIKYSTQNSRSRSGHFLRSIHHRLLHKLSSHFSFLRRF